MQLNNILTKECTFFKVNLKSKKKVLEFISDAIATQIPSLRTFDIFDELINRERLGSTALGQGVAIPHCRLEKIDRPISCFMLLNEGIDFDCDDKIPVDIIFSLIVPMEADQTHLELLSQIAALFRQEKIREKIRRAASQSELYEQVVSV